MYLGLRLSFLLHICMIGVWRLIRRVKCAYLARNEGNISANDPGSATHVTPSKRGSSTPRSSNLLQMSLAAVKGRSPPELRRYVKGGIGDEMWNGKGIRGTRPNYRTLTPG
ncbi:hypothetical protein EDB84DRAFT_176919 [Lactarius hengduanensis]|nr:hypothetical protein EDB84DRAFT_176919 [Lactarius hengduanensis]